MTEERRRAAVRAAYEGRCGYCTVHETEAGTELEIDHFQPRSVGESDTLDNPVYCCTACNRLKGDFWPTTDPLTATRRLLHPKRDDLTEHLREEPDGPIVALIATGPFTSNVCASTARRCWHCAAPAGMLLGCARHWRMLKLSKLSFGSVSRRWRVRSRMCWRRSRGYWKNENNFKPLRLDVFA